MTPKQKQLKLATIKSLINAAGFTIDHWGNYKQSLDGIDYRIKIKKINILIDSKKPTSKSWYKHTSQSIIKLDMNHFSSFIRRFTSQSN